MDWKQELDELIASTMAFAKDLKSKPTSNLTHVVRIAEQALVDRSNAIPILAANTLSTGTMSERDEIVRRVSNFRAHQEKTARDREEYYLKMKAIMMAPPVDPKLSLLNSRKNPPA